MITFWQERVKGQYFSCRLRNFSIELILYVSFTATKFYATKTMLKIEARKKIKDWHLEASR